MRRAVGVLMLAGLTGCASAPEMRMAPAPTGGPVAVRFSEGDAVMLSGGDAGAVALEPLRYNQGSRRIFFRVAAYNRSGRPVNFGPENVSIQLDDGSPVPVETFDSLRHAALVRADFTRAVAGVAAVAGMASAYTDDNPYRGRATLHRTMDGYARANASIADGLRRQVRGARDLVLQTTTIDPNSSFAGGIAADQPALSRRGARSMLVTASFAGEQHRFRLFIAPEGVPMPSHAAIPAVWRGQVQEMVETPQTWLFGEPFRGSGLGGDERVVAVRRF